MILLVHLGCLSPPFLLVFGRIAPLIPLKSHSFPLCLLLPSLLPWLSMPCGNYSSLYSSPQQEFGISSPKKLFLICKISKSPSSLSLFSFPLPYFNTTSPELWPPKIYSLIKQGWRSELLKKTQKLPSVFYALQSLF